MSTPNPLPLVRIVFWLLAIPCVTLLMTAYVVESLK